MGQVTGLLRVCFANDIDRYSDWNSLHFISLFYLLTMPQGMRSLSSLIRDRTCAPCIGSMESETLGHWEGPSFHFNMPPAAKVWLGRTAFSSLQLLKTTNKHLFFSNWPSCLRSVCMTYYKLSLLSWTMSCSGLHCHWFKRLKTEWEKTQESISHPVMQLLDLGNLPRILL